MTEITLVDDSGQQVIMENPARRIVCLNGDAPEALVAMGAGDLVVGVPENTAIQPELMKKMPNAVSIGASWNSANIEQILSCQPDTVITLTSTAPELQRKLSEANITVVYLDGYILEKMPGFFERLSLIIGNPDSSKQYIEFYNNYLKLIDTRLSDISVDQYPSVYIELGSESSTAGIGSGGDSLIRMAHGRNIASNINTQWPKVSKEWIIEQDPEILIKTAYPTDTQNYSLSEIRDRLMKRPGYSAINAIHNNRVYVINSRLVYGDQGIITLIYCVKALYPDRFSDIDPNQVLHHYAQDFVPGSDIADPFFPELPVHNIEMN